MKKTDDQKPDTENSDSDELLGDLESIKELLDEEQSDAGDEADSSNAQEGPDVPLLDDMVEGAYTLDDSDSLLSATPALGGGRRSRRQTLSGGAERKASTR